MGSSIDKREKFEKEREQMCKNFSHTEGSKQNNWTEEVLDEHSALYRNPL
jgi:hypothetical protein